MLGKSIAAVIATITLASAASAATVYSDRAGFNAAGGGTGYYGDLNLGPANSPAPFSFGPVSVTGSATYWPDGTPGLYGYVNDSGWVQMRLDTFGDTATFSTASAIKGFGFDLRPYFDGFGGDLGETISFVANTGESGSFVTPATNDVGFIGIFFSAGVTSITFAATDGGGNDYSWFGIDNIQTWSDAAGPGGVPEPASWAMMIAGFGLAGAAMRRRRVSLAFG